MKKRKKVIDIDDEQTAPILDHYRKLCHLTVDYREKLLSEFMTIRPDTVEERALTKKIGAVYRLEEKLGVDLLLYPLAGEALVRIAAFMEQLKIEKPHLEVNRTLMNTDWLRKIGKEKEKLIDNPTATGIKKKL